MSADVRSILSLSFRERANLPENIKLFYCGWCDFGFTTPARQAEYNEYYRANMNDQLGLYDMQSSLDLKKYNAQADVLGRVLEKRDGVVNLIDVGCGRGGLLNVLMGRFGNINCYGFDPNVNVGTKGGISFVNTLGCGGSVKYELVIMSHTLEHVVDLKLFGDVVSLMGSNGFMYIEVPDASRYLECGDREFLGAIDRLHVNHFTINSVNYLLDKHGLKIVDSGNIDFEYKVGKLFPALYVLARVGSCDSKVTCGVYSGSYFDGYLSSECMKAQSLRCSIAGRPVLVYGFGDNFFRARSLGGPLDGVDILGVIDKDWISLSNSIYSASYRFMSAEAAAANHLSSNVLISVSYGAEEIKEYLTSLGFSSIALV